MASAAKNPNKRSTVGRRCELGCEDWPDTQEFARCLHCGEVTTRYSGLAPLPLEEAQSMLRHARFNAFYSKYCEAQRIPVAGDLPEWYESRLPTIEPDLLVPGRRDGQRT